MALYARLDRAEVKGLARRFGIDDMTVFAVMDGGSENSNYRIESQSGSYVLTLCDQKSFQQATNLASLLIYLTDHGIRTSRVVASIEGPVVIQYDEKPVLLKHHIDGEIAADLSGDCLIQLGEEMARLHKIAAPSYLPRSFPYGRSYFSEVLNSNLDHAYVGWLSEKTSYLQEQIPADLPTTLIHGDVFFDNLIVQGDRLMAIIDFEEACHYYRSFDLGMAIVGACRNKQGISFLKVRKFLRGYQSKMALEQVERESLKAFAVYAAVATSFWRFRQYHQLRPDPRCHDKHVEMQTLADTISEYSDMSFTELFG